MNKENAHLFLPLVKALAEGKTIQYLFDKKWHDLAVGDIAFVEPPNHYRIKPEPRVRWAVYLNGTYVSTWPSEESARKWANARNSYELVKFVEEISA